MKVPTSCVVVLVLVGVVCAPAGLADDENGARKITISFVDRDVRDVISAICDFGGGNVIISPRVEGKVTLQVKDVTWVEALKQAAEAVGAVARDEGNNIYRIEPKPADDDPRPDPSKRVSFAFTDTDIREVIAAIADFAELNVILSPKVEGKVTVRLNSVPAKAAIEQIAKTLGYAMVSETGGGLRIRPKPLVKSRLISVDFKKEPVRQAITAIADFADLTVIVAPDVQGEVSITVDDTPVRDVLNAVAKQAGAIVREEIQGILRVEKP